MTHRKNSNIFKGATCSLKVT